KIAYARVGIDFRRCTTDDALDDLQSCRRANSDFLSEEIKFVPRRPAFDTEIGTEAQWVNWRAGGALKCGHRRQIDDRQNLARDIGKAVAQRGEDLRRPV